MSALLENETVIPKEREIALANQSSKELAAIIPKKGKDIQVIIKTAKGESDITLPFSAIKLLHQILIQMAEGNAVTLIPTHAELTTQEAANLLNVSRPFLIKLLEKGEIPFHKTGTHRRIKFIDLLKFKSQHERKGEQALSELTKQAQELNMGY
jgi:excisionase family DNA binding protein